MADSMRVANVEQLEHFRESLVKFVEAASDSLLSVEMDVRRFVDWILHEQPRVLRQAHLDSIEEVAQARTALERKKMGGMEGRHPDVIEEEKALRRAKARQEDLEERIANVRKWGKQMERAVDDYQGSARPLGFLLDPPASVAFLDQALNRVRAYLQEREPTLPLSAPQESMARSGEEAADAPAPEEEPDEPN